MRIFPLITAVLVIFALYAFVFQRDRLFETVIGPEASDTQTDTQTVAQTDDAPAAAVEGIRRVSVVALVSQAETIDRGVVVRGRTEAARQVDVQAETTGQIVSTPLRRGSFVEEGQVMCRLDPGSRTAALAEAEARLAEARINAVAADQLAEGGFGSETRKIAAEAALQSALASVERATLELTRITVKAPFSGVLEDDTAEFGALLSPGGPSGATCGTILELDPIKIVGFVPETLVQNVTEGAQAGAELSRDRQVVGTVRFVSRSADETTRTFRVEIEVENADLSIRAGETAQLFIASEGADAHLIPASSLTLNDAGNLGVRHVVEANTGPVAAFAPVTVVRDTVDGVWVSGLPEEVVVIVVGQDFVTAGTALEVTLREGDA